MADLITNLNSIYNTKLQIKEAIGTESDVFADYPTYITNSKPSGYTYVTENGDHSVYAYSYVNVNVPVPAGYVIPSGTKQISANGSDIDVSAYAAIDVLVDGSTVYENTTITENGDYNIASYGFAYVSVPVPAGYIIPSGTKSITENGSSIDVNSYASVDVNVPVPAGYVIPTGTYTITSNGTYDVSSYVSAYVNVSGGGPSFTELTGIYDIYYKNVAGEMRSEQHPLPTVYSNNTYYILPEWLNKNSYNWGDNIVLDCLTLGNQITYISNISKSSDSSRPVSYVNNLQLTGSGNNLYYITDGLYVSSYFVSPGMDTENNIYINYCAGGDSSVLNSYNKSANITYSYFYSAYMEWEGGTYWYTCDNIELVNPSLGTVTYWDSSNNTWNTATSTSNITVFDNTSGSSSVNVSIKNDGVYINLFDFYGMSAGSSATHDLNYHPGYSGYTTLSVPAGSSCIVSLTSTTITVEFSVPQNYSYKLRIYGTQSAETPSNEVPMSVYDAGGITYYKSYRTDDTFYFTIGKYDGSDNLVEEYFATTESGYGRLVLNNGSNVTLSTSGAYRMSVHQDSLYTLLFSGDNLGLTCSKASYAEFSEDSWGPVYSNVKIYGINDVSYSDDLAVNTFNGKTMKIVKEIPSGDASQAINWYPSQDYDLSAQSEGLISMQFTKTNNNYTVSFGTMTYPYINTYYSEDAMGNNLYIYTYKTNA